MLLCGARGLDEWKKAAETECRRLVNDELAFPGNDPATVRDGILSMLRDFCAVLVSPRLPYARMQPHYFATHVDPYFTEEQKAAVRKSLAGNRFVSLMELFPGDALFERCAHPWMRDPALGVLASTILEEFREQVQPGLYLDNAWRVKRCVTYARARHHMLTNHLSKLFHSLRDRFEVMVLRPHTVDLIDESARRTLPSVLLDLICSYVHNPQYNAARRKRARDLLAVRSHPREYDRIQDIQDNCRRCTTNFDSINELQDRFERVDALLKPLLIQWELTRVCCLPRDHSKMTRQLQSNIMQQCRAHTEMWLKSQTSSSTTIGSSELVAPPEALRRVWEQEWAQITKIYNVKPVFRDLMPSLKTWYIAVRPSLCQ